MADPAIRLKPSTIKRLADRKIIAQDTYDNVINRILDQIEKQERNQAQ